MLLPLIQHNPPHVRRVGIETRQGSGRSGRNQQDLYFVTTRVYLRKAGVNEGCREIRYVIVLGNNGYGHGASSSSNVSIRVNLRAFCGLIWSGGLVDSD